MFISGNEVCYEIFTVIQTHRFGGDNKTALSSVVNPVPDGINIFQNSGNEMAKIPLKYVKRIKNIQVRGSEIFLSGPDPD